uniref:BZIP domain-containing protein n=1 Tax=Oryzias latipes TaxID=8090 RepID=A0A3B3HG98_ORYLA
MSKTPDGAPLLPTALPHQMTLDPARLRACSSQLGSARRRKREMIPADQKDATYWAKRNKNNEAAKRSREKRRFQDLLMGGQLLALTEENAQLRAQLLSLHTAIHVFICYWQQHGTEFLFGIHPN